MIMLQHPRPNSKLSNQGEVPQTSMRTYQTARTNNAGGAQFADDQVARPFAKGALRCVALGRYIAGKRKGQKCAIKWFKSGSGASSKFFTYDIKAVNKALEIIREFNYAGIIDQPVRLNVPDVWVISEGNGYLSGKKVLVEPFIEDFGKWNSCVGWFNGSLPWGRVMQALSHFSCYITNGNYLLCGLQGGFYAKGAVVTDPVIYSRAESYGPTDMGKKGICNFFAHHKCNEFCRNDWTKPKRARAMFKPVQSLTMWNAVHGRYV